MKGWSLDDFLLNHIVCYGLEFLLDASMLIGCLFFLNHIVCCDLVFLLDARLVIGYIYLNHLVVVGLRPCWMEAWSLDDCLLNHIGCCGLVFLLDASLLIGLCFS